MPPVNYENHTNYSQLNGGLNLSSNNYFLYNLNRNFTFYDSVYAVVYVNENGYITLGSGESAFVQNLLQNHFQKKRISCLFQNLDINPS